MTPTLFAADDPAAVAHFTRTGWVLTEVLGPAGAADLDRWITEVAAWPSPGPAAGPSGAPTAGDGWLHHRELTEHGPALCRTENIVPFHRRLAALLTTGPMVAVASALLGEPAVLYKDKVNYKQPGGAGYAPHQDAPAYPFVDRHVSCMVAVDRADTTNGCLEVVSGAHRDLLATDDDGCLTTDVVAALAWAPVVVEAGQCLWFHSRTPHRSGPNRSATPRRALYPTYNAAAEGDLRADYYAAKLAAFTDAAHHGRTVRVSLINDFQGVPVPD